MKNLFVRAFVLSLAVTGIAASVKASTPNASAQVKVAAVAGDIVPSCAPNDPDGCGID